MGLTAFNRYRKLNNNTEEVKTENTSIIDEMLNNNIEEVKTENTKKPTKKDIEKLKNKED